MDDDVFIDRAAPGASNEASSGRQPTVFFSYSRSEAMFVDDLGQHLEQHGYDTWIDYLELVPGSDWNKQLDQAVDSCDVVLLVVSKRAVTSGFVEEEWERARDRRRPIILVIAEAAPLNPLLKGLPWVDMRSRNRSRYGDLVQEIERARSVAASHSPMPPPAPPPPESGFRAPLRVWLAFLTSIAIAVCSLVAVWTLVIPAVLLPLPVRILRRSFNYTDVRNALIGLPMAVLITDGAISRSDDFTAVGDAAFGVALFAGPALYLLIRGGSFRRWVEPSAARPSGPSRNLSREARQPAKVRYRVDAVPEDRGYADCVEQVLSEFAHERVEDGDASVILRFVSQFHDVTDIDPAARTIPIVVADPDDDLPVQLRRTQWIDLRRGMDRRKLEALGQHLDEPNELFRIIGSPPPHEQRILPKGVQGLFVTLWIGIGTVIGYAVLVPMGLRSELSVIGPTALVWSAALGLLMVGVMLWLTRKLRQRRPGRLRASLIPLLAMGVIAVAVPVMNNYEDRDLSTEGVNGIDNANAVVIIPLLLMLYFWLFKSGAIRRWIPARSGAGSGDGHDPAGTTRSSKRPLTNPGG